MFYLDDSVRNADPSVVLGRFFSISTEVQSLALSAILMVHNKKSYLPVLKNLFEYSTESYYNSVIMNQHQAGKLLRACHTLFGSSISINDDFLYYVQLSGLKSAYRKKARATHPDVNQTMNRIEGENTTRLFVEVKQAYDVLSSFISQRDDGGSIDTEYENTVHPQSKSTTTRQKKCKKHGRDIFYFEGSIPRNHLRFAEYLYYAGIISWQHLIESIVWQRRQRPNFGTIAAQWAWLSSSNLRIISQRRKPGEYIGETAVRFHFLNQTQVDIVLSHQKKLQKPIGHFFIKHGHLSWGDLVRFLNKCKLHNAHSSRAKTPWN